MSQVEAEQYEAEAPARNKVRIPFGALRIVLFGMPDSGKTMLLASLVQASQTATELLQGEVEDLSGNLSELHRHAGDRDAAPTQEEVLAYPLEFRPHELPDGSTPRSIRAVFYDCNGRSATALFSRRELADGGPGSQLAREMLNADAMILALDGSSSKEAINRNFRQFIKFLQILQQNRSRQTEINGMPVYLVLTKCDLLARADQSFPDWVDGIESRKVRLAEQFRQQLAERAPKNGHAFGEVRLDVWATARRRPALEGGSKDDTPFQAAELFRDCLQSAAEYRERRKAGQRKLHFTLLTVGAVAGVMALLIALFLMGRQGVGPVQLSKKIQSYFEDPNNKDVRRLDLWKQKLETLNRFRGNKFFSGVGQTLQDHVKEEIAEMEAYRGFSQDLQNIERKIGTPVSIHSLKDLAKLESAVQKMRMHSQYAKYVGNWNGTEKIEETNRWLKDADAAKAEVKRVEAKYQSVIDDGNKVLDFVNKSDFNSAVPLAKKVIKRAALTLPDWDAVAEEPIPNSQRITKGQIGDFETVEQLREQWRKLRDSVKRYTSFGM